ncbi:MAG: DUF4118 domain-containing protein [Magnetococcales bacterium]|nr:DUF4118 domain-containing protein [Magnetococcales bacterium]
MMSLSRRWNLQEWRGSVREIVFIISVIGTATWAIRQKLNHLLLSTVFMVYLFLVFLAALKLSRLSAVTASIACTIVYYYYFIPPYASFEIHDLQYFFDLTLMLVIALTTSHMASGLKTQITLAQNRERRIRSLFELAKDLTGISEPEQLIHTCHRFVADNFQTRYVLLIPDVQGRFTTPASECHEVDLKFAEQILHREVYSDSDVFQNIAGDFVYLPLRGSSDNQGILVVDRTATKGSAEQESLLWTGMTLIGLALERLRYAARARQASLEVESERLRNALLASLSHDIRTPVAAMAGIADAMILSLPPGSHPVHGMLDSMRQQIAMMLSDVDKLLDMTRLHRDIVTLHKEWQVLEEVVGAALERCRNILQGHEVVVTMAEDIPLLEMDAMMMERVFCNLLENVARHTPAGTQVNIEANVEDQYVVVHFADDGPGFPSGQEEAIFSEFVHGQRMTGTVGVGLGLAIVQSVVKAHGGKIGAEHRHQRGASFKLFFPIGDPPDIILDQE